jgi:hypothetical protein
MLSKRDFSHIAALLPDGERPNAEERRRAKRLAHALELAELANTLCVELDEILVEWLAREFADVRAIATQRGARSVKAATTKSTRR